MGILYTTATIEIALLEDGMHLLTFGDNQNIYEAWDTKVKHSKFGVIAMPIKWVGRGNEAKVYNPNTIVTVFTTLDQLSESDRIDLEWDLMNR